MRPRFLNHSTVDLAWVFLIALVISVLGSVAVNVLIGC